MSRPRVVDVTLTSFAAILAAGDLVADTQAVTNGLLRKNYAGILRSLLVIDEDDQKQPLDIYFLDVNTSFGTEGDAPNIADAGIRGILGKVSVAAADYKDLGNGSVAYFPDLGIMVKPATDSQDFYVAVVNGSGTPTYTAGGLKLRLGIEG